MNTKSDIIAILKYGKKEFMYNLLHKGELYLNTFEYYKTHEDKEIQDECENSCHIGKAIVYIGEKEIRLNQESTQVRMSTSYTNGNVYCMYGIKKSQFKNLEGHKIHEIPNSVATGFGDTAILISNPKEFLRRISIKLKELKYSFDFVKYYDYTTYQGRLDPFCKREKYSQQNEFRLYIPNQLNRHVKIYIGSITDIALDVTNKMIKNIDEDGEEYIIR